MALDVHLDAHSPDSSSNISSSTTNINNNNISIISSNKEKEHFSNKQCITSEKY